MRSGVKRSFRSNKHESGKYAAAEAARLNAKLAAVKDKDRPIVAPLDSVVEMVTEDQLEGSYDSEALFACSGLLDPRCVMPQAAEPGTVWAQERRRRTVVDGDGTRLIVELMYTLF